MLACERRRREFWSSDHDSPHDHESRPRPAAPGRRTFSLCTVRFHTVHYCHWQLPRAGLNPFTLSVSSQGRAAWHGGSLRAEGAPRRSASRQGRGHWSRASRACRCAILLVLVFFLIHASGEGGTLLLYFTAAADAFVCAYHSRYANKYGESAKVERRRMVISAAIWIVSFPLH
jgi:hypothetical protein